MKEPPREALRVPTKELTTGRHAGTLSGEPRSRVRAIPALAQGRTLSSADDIAAVLHGRVTKWLNAAGSRHQPERIVGLLPATPCITDPDTAQALGDRRKLIEEKARTLVLEALQRRVPWTRHPGGLPQNPILREDRLRRLDTIATYRDLWQVSGHGILGPEPRTREQAVQRQVAKGALTAVFDDGLTPNSLNETRQLSPGLERGLR